MALLTSILAIVVLIGVLVFVHEFGHFIVARLFKVKVISFSIGFGPRMFGFKRGETDWVVRWLPLGGYVYMLGSDPSHKISEEDKDVAFNHKPLWQRSLIILAGPLANLLLPIPILFFVLLANYDQDLPPVVGQVLDDSPADDAGLEPGDQVVAIDGEPVAYWKELRSAIIDAPGETLELTIDRAGSTVDLDVTPEPTMRSDPMGIVSNEIGLIGITLGQYRPIISISDPDGAAARAGLETFDEIVAVNGERIETWAELARIIRSSPGETLELVVVRGEVLPIDFGRIEVQRPLKLELVPETDGDDGIAGLQSANMVISQVEPDSPAAEAGLRRGDRVLALDGEEYDYFPTLQEDIVQSWEDAHILTIERDGEVMDLELQAEQVTVVGEYKEERPLILLGFHNLERQVMPDRIDVSFGARFAFAANYSIDTTADASKMLVLFIVRMAEGEVSTKHIGGPIMIGHLASKAGEQGIERFLEMLAMISINLGIINLLPIPVLDGGHLLLFAMEGIKRGPLSARTRQIASFVGLTIVIFLFVFAFKNDIERYWSGLFG